MFVSCTCREIGADFYVSSGHKWLCASKVILLWIVVVFLLANEATMITDHCNNETLPSLAGLCLSLCVQEVPIYNKTTDIILGVW